MTENDRRLCEAYRTALKHWASKGIDGHERESELLQFASELASSWIDCWTL